MFGILLTAHLAAATGVPYFEVSPGSPSVSMMPPDRQWETGAADGPFLIGAGELLYTPNPSDFPLGKLRDDDEFGIDWAQMELSIDANGAIKKCQATELNSSSWRFTDETLCPALISTSKFKYAEGFQLDAPIGYLTVSVTWQRRKHLTPNFSFTGNGKGPSLSLRYSKPKTAKEKPGCDIWSTALTVEDQQRVCDQLSAQPSFQAKLKKMPKSVYYSEDFGAYVTAWLSPGSLSDLPAENLIEWRTRGNPYRYNPSKDRFRYPNALPEGASILATETGYLRLSITRKDKPAFALENYVDGVSTLALEIGSDGGVKSCRPYRSSESAALDWYACKLAIARAKFVLAPGETITGKQYMLHDVRWDMAY